MKTSFLRSSARGRERILASDDGGAPRRIRFEIDALDADFDGARAPLRLRGVVVDVTHTSAADPDVVTLGGKSPDGDSREVLADLFAQPAAADVPSDDEAFGTDAPQPIGGSWPIRSDVVERALRSELSITGGTASGAMRLVRFGEDAGTPFEEVEGNLRIEPVELADLPAGATVEHGSVVVGMHWLVPTTSMPRLEDDSTIAVDVTLATRANAEVEVHSHAVRHRTFKPLDDAER